MLEILNARADLSRRAVIYHMQGLSFREFLAIKTGHEFPTIGLEELITNHVDIAREVLKKIKPLEHFGSYLNHGYFPFFQEVPDLYHLRLEEVVNMTLEIELPLLRSVDISYIPKLKHLLHIISNRCPLSQMSPNSVSALASTGIRWSATCFSTGSPSDQKPVQGYQRDNTMQKPEKIYLENTNFQFAFTPKMQIWVT